MPLLSLDTGMRQYKKLEEAIQVFNELDDKDASQKIYQLQVINYLIDRVPPSFELNEWLASRETNAWELQLQNIGVHRDASAFLKSIEFAKATQYASDNAEAIEPNPEDTLYSLLTERDTFFNAPTRLEEFESINQRLFALFQQDEMLQKRVMAHQHFLALSYAKLEAIQNVVEQSFDEYSTEALSRTNNANFFLTIVGEPEPLVVRVEDRTSLDDEADLQSHPVAEYFSEDYVTVMLPFKNEDDEVAYQPVVISQYASDGDLLSYAERIDHRSTDEKGQIAQDCFLQLSDFLIKLEDSGHYHPDIKLSNFLYDKGRVFCSDRKTLLKTAQVPIGQISTTPNFAPPEYLEKVHINWEKGAIIPKRRSDRIDMPSFMRYQVGQVVLEYLESTDALSDRPLSHYIQNLILLHVELTRENPSDRLKLVDFNQLLEYLEKPPQVFLNELETYQPIHRFSFFEDAKALEALLEQKDDTETYLQQLSDYIEKLPQNILEDMRYRSLKTAFENKVSELEETLQHKDKRLASRAERMFAAVGIREIPKRTPDSDVHKKILDVLQRKKVSAIPEVVESKKEGVATHKNDSYQTLTGEETASGTCIRTPVQAENVPSETFMRTPVQIEDAPSGTFMRTPVQIEDAPSGTFMKTPERGASPASDAETELERYSPASNLSGTFMTTRVNTPMKEENIKKQHDFSAALESMRQETPKQPPEAADIDSSIQRGDASAKKKPKKEEDDDEVTASYQPK